ncbi:MAG TPA: HAMP domain-containing sensor histidine kinase [Edaphocola sp.]|nr:HAMP domain-containing sensor histidine kinase [Edaphocola sp.]
MNLLKRIIRSHLLYASSALIFSIPVFYFVTRALCIQDVDEALEKRKKELAVQLESNRGIITRLPWQDINDNNFIYSPVIQPPGEDYFETINGKDEPFRALHSYLQMDGRIYPVVLRISLIGIEDLVQGIVITEILLLLLILGGLLWINRQQSLRIWKPFYQALEQLRKFKLDRGKDLDFMDTDITEFRDLQKAGMILTERAYQTYLQQKEFIENAAHEMQTPLASMRAILEMMIQHESLGPGLSRQVQELQDVISRVSRLNKGLLLLAKIDNNQFNEIIPLYPAGIIQKIRARLQMQLDAKKIILSEHYEDAVLQGNPVLSDILLSNLLTNAIQYAPEGGRVIINVSTGYIEIKNAGEPLPFPEERLFQRFQKGYSVSFPGGNGLGLAIVWQICETFHYRISYQYKSSFHQFTLDFSSPPES